MRAFGRTSRPASRPAFAGRPGGQALFGSELKALRFRAAFKAEIGGGARALFLRDGYVRAPYSIYGDTFKLPPGTIRTVAAADDRREPVRYWSAREVAQR